MFVNLITYDSSYGDGRVFDDYTFSTENYDAFISGVIDRFEGLLKDRTLIIDRESGRAEIVELLSGCVVESYIVVYPNECDAANKNNGLELAYNIFYNPDEKELSHLNEPEHILDCLPDGNDGVLEAWGLEGIIRNPPPELDVSADGPNCALDSWDLTRFLFGLYQSRLASK